MTEPVPATGAPGAEDYIALRAACGPGERGLHAVRIGLANSLHAVTLREGCRLDGTGRLVGDGGCFAQVVDIAVHPDRQGRGHGSAMLAALSGWADANLPSTCYPSLIALARAVPFCARAGFEEARGMGLLIP